MRYARVPLSDEQLGRLARAVLKPGGVFSRRALPEGLMSPETYQEVLQRLLEAGLLVLRGAGPEAGVELTAAGRSWLGRYIT